MPCDHGNEKLDRVAAVLLRDIRHKGDPAVCCWLSSLSTPDVVDTKGAAIVGFFVGQFLCF